MYIVLRQLHSYGYGDDDEKCHAEVLSGLASTLTFYTLCLSWWVVELPHLFFKRPPEETDQDGQPMNNNFSGRSWRFFCAIAWNCVRVLQPSYVVLMAMAGMTHLKSCPMIYYFGRDPGRQNARSFNRQEWAKVILTDGTAIIGEILLIASALTGGDGTSEISLKPMWMLHLMPAAFWGLYLVVIYSFKWTPPMGRMYFGFLIVLLPGVAIIPALYSVHKESGMAGAMAAQYGLPLLPLALCTCCSVRSTRSACILVTLIWSAIIRIVPLAIGVTLKSPDFFWFCTIPSTSIAALLGVMGGGLVLLMAFKGVGQVEEYRDSWRRVWQWHSLPEQVPVTLNMPEDVAPGITGNRVPTGLIGLVRIDTLPTYNEALTSPPAFTPTPARRETAPPEYSAADRGRDDDGDVGLLSRRDAGDVV